MTRSSFRVHKIRKGIGSTHQGLLGTYTTNIKITSPAHKQSMVGRLECRIYQWHYVSGKEFLDVYAYEGHCRMIIQQRIGRSIMELM